jgi:signal transduction histidine kinase
VLERTLFRAVVAFRLIALLWMVVLVAVTVVTVPDLSVLAVVGVTFVAAMGTAGLLVASRRGVADRRLVVLDAGAACVVAAGPWMAGTTEPFYGGYPMSAVVLVAFSAGTIWALVLAGAQFVVIVAGAVAVGPVDVGDLTRTGLTLLITAWVVGWVMSSLREADALRREAEEARVRAEERAALAAGLHDSAIQTLVVLRQQADDPDQVRALARRQERELRALVSDRGAAAGGLVDRLGEVADDVEDLHGLHVERVFVGDAEAGPAVEALVGATKELLVNVARHAATDRAHLFAEVGDETVTVSVRDRGTGFDTAAIPAGTGLTQSVRDRVTGARGEVRIRSHPGQGTDVELVVPR